MGEAERRQQQITEKEQQWRDLTIRIEALIKQLGFTKDEEEKVLLEKRLANYQTKRETIGQELKTLETDWQPTPNFVNIPDPNPS